ncbi:MAG: tRNA preQ1(34) S-adenosylmethionine ribosyltransferase-isomerase QueA [Rhodobacteraceae bacterium]|nr:tRNA preQ1(34) S-adenosylmethionine ribosyltransferase-isomerase QueA [Paracoccaceae bacterium]
MKLSDFDFHLPEDLIATRPAKPRSSARLLVAGKSNLTDKHVYDLPQVLRPGDRLVLNDTRVIPARLRGARDRNGAKAKIEVTLLDPRPGGRWTALVKPLRKLREGERVQFSDDLSAILVDRIGTQALLEFNLTGDDFGAALNEAGAMPLPPYIETKRASDDQDKADYQTVWAKNEGAVAAPTASLHFDDPLLAALEARGIERSFVTLHVGAGTFLPVKVDDISDHKMHAEWGSVTQAAADEINATRNAGGRIVPVGTTALRLLESTVDVDRRVLPFEGPTDIFITPGFRFRAADALMTNFHLPKSTLVMLVSAFIGTQRIREIYDHAISERYRFFSYGDSSILMPDEP